MAIPTTRSLDLLMSSVMDLERRHEPLKVQMMSDLWKYRIVGEDFGPVSGNEVSQMIRDGLLSADDLVQNIENTAWIEIKEVPAFSSSVDSVGGFGSGMNFADSLDDFVLESADESREKSFRTQSTNANVSTVNQLNFNSTAVQSGSSTAVQADVAEVTPERSPKPRDEQSAPPRKRDSDADIKTTRTRTRPRVSVKHDPLMAEIAAELEARKAGLVPVPSEGLRSTNGEHRARSSAAQSQPSVPSVATSAQATMSVSQVRTAEFPTVTKPVTPPTPYRAPSPSPSRSVGSSFSMPEPKTLGILGGVLLIPLIGVAFAFGWITLPFGGGSNELPGLEGAVVSCFLDLQSQSGAPEKHEWDTFKSLVENKLKPLISSAGNSSADAQEAAKLLVEVSSFDPRKDLKKISAAKQKLQPLFAKLTKG